MSYQSFEEIINVCTSENKEFWQVILEEDIAERNVTIEESMHQMQRTWEAMLNSAESYEGDLKSQSGLVGGDGQKMADYQANHGADSLCGSFVDECIAGALQMGESNACMKRIVAAPTAGACGVLPAVLVPYFKRRCPESDKMLKAMYVAAGIGQIIAHRSSISGAAGGCQAEIGSASSMAAGALVYLQGGDCKMIVNAAAMAMKNLLGLVCDPVGGLTEIPGISRNVMAMSNAVMAANMVMLGFDPVIPFDEVIGVMMDIGRKMPEELRCTCRGGLCVTETACKKVREIKK